MDIAEIERLVELIGNANIRELTLRQGDARITLRKSTPAPIAETALAVVEEAIWPGEVSRPGTPLSESAAPDVPQSSSPIAQITAPAVGYFRHAKPAVGAQARVEAGQVVGAVEAMNLLIEVTAPATGVVTEALIEEGRPVEYGQALFAFTEAS
jgi:acetyl-CoA carboxylase biotin carboxyl carrier protein